MSQDTESLPAVTINNHQLDVAKEFTYLGSTMTDNLSMDSAISRLIGRTTSTLARFSKRVWDKAKLTLNTKITVYRACVLSAHSVLEARKEAQDIPHAQPDADSEHQMVGPHNK